MLHNIIKRILYVIPIIFGITLLVFSLGHLLPGDPIQIMAGTHHLSKAQYAEVARNLHLDKPLWYQYFLYVKDLLHGNLGYSLVTHIPVTKEFFELFPATLELSLYALIFAIAVGLPAGIFAAIKRGKFSDYSVMTISLTGYSMPIFWWGLLLMLLFSITLGLTPVSGRIATSFWIDHTTGFALIDAFLSGDMQAVVSVLKHLILPTIALGTIPMAIIARMTRSSLLEVIQADYILVAKAKGLSYYRVVLVHALRNAWIPIITIIGLQVSSLFAGAVLTETIFSWPGIGKWIIHSVMRRDYPVIQGGILLIALNIILVNLFIDILYTIANPKLRK